MVANLASLLNPAHSRRLVVKIGSALLVDRDSGDLAHLFDEENPAVKQAIAQAIEGAHRNGRLVGLCGQAPSDKPKFAAFLVEKGIDSISLTPDSVMRAINIVADAEKQISKEDVADLDESVKAAIQADKQEADDRAKKTAV